MHTAPPLTLAYIVNLYPPYVVGGNELLAQQVITALRERGHTIHVLTGRGRDLPDDGYTHQALDLDLDQKEAIFLGGLPLTLRRLVNWHLYNGRSAEGVRAALEAIRPDVTIAWNLYMASAAPLAAARRAARPVIAHPADKWLLYMADDIRKLVPATSWANRLALDAIHALVQPALKRMSRPDYILAVSEFIRDLHTTAGYAPAQSRAAWLGIDPAHFPFTPHEHPGRERSWRLMYAGQLWAGKGPQVAAQAVRRLRDTPGAPPFTLDIYGGGAANFVDYLRQTVDDLGVGDAVTLHGFVEQAQLAEEFRCHDAYLFCSIWDEPFSGGLLEAMATGIPTVATTAGGTPEAVRDGENGLLVPPGDPAALADALLRLVGSPALYAQLGAQAAQEVAARWSFAAYIDRLERLYTAIAGHRPLDPPLDIAALDLAADPGALLP